MIDIFRHLGTYMFSNSVVLALTSMGRGSPVMTVKEFSSLSGMTEDAVRKSIQRGYLPSFKLGRGRVLVNIARLTLDALGVEIEKPVSEPKPSPASPRSAVTKRKRKR
jgi:hypothetical protein